MIAYHKNGLLYFKFHLLAGLPGLVHAIFARVGGHSPRPFESLNVGLNSADAAVNVASNRSLVAEAFNTRKPLLFPNQVHGTDVVGLKKTDERDCLRLAPDTTADALITDIAGLHLAIQIADCQAVVLYDPVRAVVANVHSGWRGSIENIIGTTIRKMQSDFDCRAADIYAAVSPSLGPCCSEFINYQSEIPEKFWCYRDSRNFFNFWAITRDQLAAAGIRQEQMEFSGICTKCNEHLFFSYRKKHPTGRFAAVIGLATH